MFNHEHPPYRCEDRDGRSIVVDENDREICACGGLPAAEQYAALMNAAYKKGYKQGYRAGKNA